MLDAQPELAALPAHHAADRWPVVVPAPMARHLVGPPPGRVEGIEVGHPLLPRVLVQLVGLHHGVIQRQAMAEAEGQVLQLVPQG